MTTSLVFNVGVVVSIVSLFSSSSSEVSPKSMFGKQSLGFAIPYNHGCAFAFIANFSSSETVLFFC